MSFSDREYMTRREPSVFSPKRRPADRSLHSTLWMVLIWLSALYVLYKVFLWWDVQQRPSRLTMPNAEVIAPVAGSGHTISNKLPPKTYAPQAPSQLEPAPSTNDTRTVRKCLSQGSVTFTDKTCPDGSVTSHITVNTANVGTVAPEATQAPREQFASPTVAETPPATATKSTAMSNQAACHSLEMAIQHIDSMARQPQSAQVQDALSAKRKKARSKQFALHC